MRAGWKIFADKKNNPCFYSGNFRRYFNIVYTTVKAAFGNRLVFPGDPEKVCRVKIP